MHSHRPAAKSGTEVAKLDASIGRRIRARRMILGLSQEELGDAIGVTQQQVKNYERAATKVSASRLHELANILDVPVEWFFREPGTLADEGQGTPVAGDGDAAPNAEDIQEAEVLPMVQDGRSNRDALLVLRLFRQTTNAEDRKTALSLLKRFGGGGERE